ncbi:hypothetical protein HDC90_004521 [Pedobacter sp. AK013]|uniref:hypothetical protein n=1 Tax=Pedobacter sp. AK013 TaxID=2723071 RepID=UPI00161298DB|nr:hypothetical protein [Pedobacter sp. AK013]MBB6239859.1 hypothetical protein [Pedobacter sp. AK013]
MRNTIKLSALVLFSICSLLVNAQTATRDNAGLQGDAGAVSGFFETSAPVNYPAGASSWWHLLDVRHSNTVNNFAMQFAGSFFNQELYFRKTNNYASQNWSKVLLETNGNVGIGTSNPNSTLTIRSASTGVSINPGASPYFGTLAFNRESGTGAIFDPSGKAFQINNGGGDQNLHIQVYNGDGTLVTNNSLVISGANGNVGIGTANLTDALTVAGKIGAREIKVSTNAGADFVFEPDYQLTDLTELEKFVKSNKHLPEIPTAKQMVENGVNLGELNIKLLQKVEELTLHLIEEHNRTVVRNKEIDELKTLLKQQQNHLNEIELKLKKDEKRNR